MVGVPCTVAHNVRFHFGLYLSFQILEHNNVSSAGILVVDQRLPPSLPLSFDRYKIQRKGQRVKKGRNKPA